MPTRVVFEKENSTDVILVNRGDEAGDYRLFMRNLRTNDKGKFSEADTAQENELFADKMIRYSPRRVKVDANSKQSVRLVVRKPRGLADGEYRSHLVLRSLPSQESVLDTTEGEDDIAVAFKPIVEVTIPIIIRHGKLHATASVSNTSLTTNEKGEQEVSLTLGREGNRSLYGDFEFWWEPANNAKPQRVATAHGIAVYHPNPIREIIVKIETSDSTLIKDGKLRIKFSEDPAYGGNAVTETLLTL